MRICLVSQEYPPDKASGGIGSQTYIKAHGLVSRGHEICVVAAGRADTGREGWDGPVRVVRIPGFHPRMRLNTEPVRWLTYSAEVAATLSLLHSRAPFDLIDFPEYGGGGDRFRLAVSAKSYPAREGVPQRGRANVTLQ